MSIASNIKAQLVGQLLAAIGNTGLSSGAALSAQKAAASAAVASALSELQSGQSLVATVTGPAKNGQLPVLVNGQAILANIRNAALPQEALRPGTQLQLRVENANDTPTLSLQSLETAVAQTGSRPTALSQNLQASLATIQLVPPQKPVEQAPAVPVVSELQQAITKTAGDAATRQGSAAPLYADLAALLTKPDAGLPQSVLKIASALLNNRIDGEQTVTALDVKQAIQTSGVFSSPRSNGTVVDAKSLLVALRQALQSDDTKPTLKSSADQEPPRRDGPVTAHKIVASSLVNETDKDKILSTLSRESEQAVERLKLHQIASLPERLNASDVPQTRQFNFEIPIALGGPFGQQTAMAGFRIEQEKKRNPKTGEPTDIWGIRFAIDADVLGPIHAHVRLAGQTISVSLWAEETATHRFFAQSMPMLEAALSENALEIGDLKAFKGKPSEPRTALAGHFLDKSS
jgi:hypothetical protein